MRYTALRDSIARQLGWKRRIIRSGRASWKQVVATGGLGLTIAASAHGLTVPDASFEDHNIDEHKASTGATVDYAYSDDGGGWIDGYSPGAGGDSAWTSRENGGAGAWIYNTAYATGTNRSVPRTGEQAISGASGYTYQVLSDTFQPNTEYSFKIHAAQPSGTGRFFLYIYDGTNISDGGDDADNLNFREVNFDHSGNADPTDWVEYSVEYTTASVGSAIGNNVGISFWSSGNVYFDDVSVDTGAPQRLGMLVDRDTGEISIVNNTGGPQDIKGYSILSSAGALVHGNWDSVTDNYDGSGGDGSVDSGDWVEFTAPGATGDLSEGALGTGTIADGATVSLGVGAWGQYFDEGDLVFEYLDGNGDLIADGSIAFTGTTQTTPFEFGDLNFDGNINGADWVAYAAGLGTDLSAMSDAQSYRDGDMNGDQANNHADFLLFEGAYDGANGAGALAALIAGVPEPSSVVIASLGLFGLAGCRRRSD